MTSVRGRCCPQKLEGTWTAKAHEIHTQEGQGWGESQADFLTGRGRREGRLLLGDNIALRLPRRKRAGGWGVGGGGGGGSSFPPFALQPKMSSFSPCFAGLRATVSLLGGRPFFWGAG